VEDYPYPGQATAGYLDNSDGYLLNESSREFDTPDREFIMSEGPYGSYAWAFDIPDQGKVIFDSKDEMLKELEEEPEVFEELKVSEDELDIEEGSQDEREEEFRDTVAELGVGGKRKRRREEDLLLEGVEVIQGSRERKTPGSKAVGWVKRAYGLRREKTPLWYSRRHIIIEVYPVGIPGLHQEIVVISLDARKQ
jgi:hypothetical protein